MSVCVLRLLFTIPWVGIRYVIVAFLSSTYLLLGQFLSFENIGTSVTQRVNARLDYKVLAKQNAALAGAIIYGA